MLQYLYLFIKTLMKEKKPPKHMQNTFKRKKEWTEIFLPYWFLEILCLGLLCPLYLKAESPLGTYRLCSAKKTYGFPLLFMQVLRQKAHLDRVRV